MDPEELSEHEQVTLQAVADRRLVLRGDELQWELRLDRDRGPEIIKTPTDSTERESLRSLYRHRLILLPDGCGRVELAARAAEWVREMKVFGLPDPGLER